MPTPTKIKFFYDPRGQVIRTLNPDGTEQQRMKYFTNESGQTETTVYIDGIFEHTYTSSGEEQNVFQIMDDKSRIAIVRIGDNLGDSLGEDGDNQLAIKYILEDHLGSSVCELARDGAFLEKEEYYPFGETSFASYGKKRYKYCGKERDTESGLYYYGARYYNAWTCRFFGVDPLKEKYHFYTPCQYAGNKPINFIDLDGKEEYEITKDFLRFGIDMNDCPSYYKGTATTYVKSGYPRNYKWFWDQVLGKFPDFLDNFNKTRINDGKAPIFTQQQKLKFDNFGINTKNLKIGNTLEHHHLNQGRIAVPITRDEHKKIKHETSGFSVKNSFGKYTGMFTFGFNIISLYIDIKTDKPDGPLGQFQSQDKIDEVYFNPNSNTFFVYTNMVKNENSVTAEFIIYKSYEWNDKYRNYEGIDPIGYGSRYEEVTGYSFTMVYDINGVLKNIEERGTKKQKI